MAEKIEGNENDFVYVDLVDDEFFVCLKFSGCNYF